MAKLPSHGPASSVDEFFLCPGIVKGYRHVSNKWDCVLSSLTLSNELVNIWSHGIAAVYYMYVVYTLLTHAWMLDALEQHFPLIAQQFGVFVAMLGSTLAHMFHSESRWHHVAWFMVDYLGIGFYCLTSAIAHYAYSRPLDENSGPISLFSTNAYLTIALLGHTCVLVSQCYLRCRLLQQTSRLYILVTGYAVAYIINFLPFLSRYYSAQEHLSSDPFHWGQFQWSLASALVMTTQVPERFAPETFYSLNGHSMMHMLLLVSFYHQSTALRMDVERWSSFPSGHQPCVPGVCLVLFLYSLVGILLTYYFAYVGQPAAHQSSCTSNGRTAKTHHD
ncbi:membrane progestin receptor gamma-A-like [Sycon ciliatum]|uniref:membrane progestin receptor gamma-A-like n=1 Tax=Sycon ciliatum TaxID=27933 RepID=UPI0031F6404D